VAARPAIVGAVVALAFIAAVVFVGVALHELDYAGSHPHAYGPAKVIAWGAGGGAVLAVAVLLLAFCFLRRQYDE
jgi:hypothetical protein